MTSGDDPDVPDLPLEGEQRRPPLSAPLSPVGFRAPDMSSVREARPPRVPVVLRTDRVIGGIHCARCVQCGVNPARPAKRRFQYVPPWVYVGLALNVLILAILYYAGRVVVDGTLPLCEDCDRAEKRGRFLRGLSLAGLFVFPVLGAFLGMSMPEVGEGADVALGVMGGVGAAITGIVAAHRTTRFDVLTAKAIDKKAGTITLLASPEMARVVGEEDPTALG